MGRNSFETIMSSNVISIPSVKYKMEEDDYVNLPTSRDFKISIQSKAIHRHHETRIASHDPKV
jgi:hypothetical protein